MKISEGCNNSCSFCIIPALRGRLKSRPLGEVMGEAERLVAAGVKELLVISQDTSAYGQDLRYAQSEWRGEARESRFITLAEALGSLGVWVRLHYVYPYPHVDDVLPLMAEGRVLAYLTFPSSTRRERAQSDAPSGQSGADFAAHRQLARNLS